MLFVLPVFAQEWDDEDFDSDDDLDIEDYSEYGDDDEVKEGVNERVRGFDVAGVMLGMTEADVKAAMKSRKYALADTETSIPEHFRYNYDAECRSRNVLVADALAGCIEGLAKKAKTQYTSRQTYKRPDTKEEMSVHFTSPFSESRVWKADYKNDVNRREGTAKNFQYQREERQRAFWYFVLQKYGEPNVGAGKWVLNADEEYSPRLVADFGRLVLESQQQYLTDQRIGQEEGRKAFKFGEYTF